MKLERLWTVSSKEHRAILAPSFSWAKSLLQQPRRRHLRHPPQPPVESLAADVTLPDFDDPEDSDQEETLENPGSLGQRRSPRLGGRCRGFPSRVDLDVDVDLDADVDAEIDIEVPVEAEAAMEPAEEADTETEPQAELEIPIAVETSQEVEAEPEAEAAEENAPARHGTAAEAIESPVESQASDPGDSFDLREALADVIEDESMHAGRDTSGVLSTVEDGFESIFSDFKKGVTATLDQGDYGHAL